MKKRVAYSLFTGWFTVQLTVYHAQRANLFGSMVG